MAKSHLWFVFIFIKYSPNRHFFTVFGNVQVFIYILGVLKPAFEEIKSLFLIYWLVFHLWNAAIFNHYADLVIIREVKAGIRQWVELEITQCNLTPTDGVVP